MKHLKLFENSNWTWDKLKSNIEDRSDLENKIIQYLYWINNTTEEYDDYKIFDLFFRDKNFVISYKDTNEQYFDVHIKDKEFVDFINNPELFKETEKYNL